MNGFTRAAKFGSAATGWMKWFLCPANRSETRRPGKRHAPYAYHVNPIKTAGIRQSNRQYARKDYTVGIGFYSGMG
jgi:hypothetical protein